MFLGNESETNKTSAVARQRILNKQHLYYNRGGTVGNGVSYLVRAKGFYNEDTSPASRKRRRIGNPLPRDITAPPFSWGI
jgi:hypothetical protein